MIIKITDIHNEDAYCPLKEALKKRSFISFEDRTNALTQPGFKSGLLRGASEKDKYYFLAVKLEEVS